MVINRELYRLFRALNDNEFSRQLASQNILFKGPRFKITKKIVYNADFGSVEKRQISERFLAHYDSPISCNYILKWENGDLPGLCDYLNANYAIPERITLFDEFDKDFYLKKCYIPPRPNDSTLYGELILRSDRPGFRGDEIETVNRNIDFWILSPEGEGPYFFLTIFGESRREIIIGENFLLKTFLKIYSENYNIETDVLFPTSDCSAESRIRVDDCTESINYFEITIDALKNIGFNCMDIFEVRLRNSTLLYEDRFTESDDTIDFEHHNYYPWKESTIRIRGHQVRDTAIVNDSLHKGYYISGLGIRLMDRKGISYYVIISFKVKPKGIILIINNITRLRSIYPSDEINEEGIATIPYENLQEERYPMCNVPRHV